MNKLGSRRKILGSLARSTLHVTNFKFIQAFNRNFDDNLRNRGPVFTMTVQAVRKATVGQVCMVISELAHLLINSQNGVGAFVLQCKRLDFHYCDAGGSSRGMK